LPTTVGHISHVVGVCAWHEVGWIHAALVVARMPDDCWEIPVLQQKGLPVRDDHFLLVTTTAARLAEVAVPAADTMAIPHPATVRLEHLRPESFHERSVA
jgi:hypothetical protein